jgi:hypothetical protein
MAMAALGRTGEIGGNGFRTMRSRQLHTIGATTAIHRLEGSKTVGVRDEEVKSEYMFFIRTQKLNKTIQNLILIKNNQRFPIANLA